MTRELHPWDQAFGALPPNWALPSTLCFGLHHSYLCSLSKIWSRRSPSYSYTCPSGKPRCGLCSGAVPSAQAGAPYSWWELGDPALGPLPCPTCTSSGKRSIIFCLWQTSFPSVGVTGCDFPVPMTSLLFGLFSAWWVSIMPCLSWHFHVAQAAWAGSPAPRDRGKFSSFPQFPCLYNGSGSHSICLMGSSWG